MIALSIDKFFAAIKGGEWHSIDGLSERLGIPASKLVELSRFLSEHGLLKYDDENHKVKIRAIWKLFLPEEEESTEPKTTVATFIIPPETSIDVQSMQISNISDVEVEVSLRIANRIKEVAIKV